MWAKGIQLNAKRGGVNIVPFLPSGTPTSGMPPTHLVVLTSLAWSALKRQPKTLRRILLLFYLYFLIKKKSSNLQKSSGYTYPVPVSISSNKGYMSVLYYS